MLQVAPRCAALEIAGNPIRRRLAQNILPRAPCRKFRTRQFMPNG